MPFYVSVLRSSHLTVGMDGFEVIHPPKIGPYLVRGIVGDGAFSLVKLVYNEETHNYFACKIVPKSRLNSESLQERFEIEIRINQQLHHPGIVKLYDLLSDERNYYVIMEFCQSGELFQYILDKYCLTEDEARPFVRQILESLDYIHSMNVTHRDLKPENLLLDQYGRVKLSDFGLSRFIPKNGLVGTPCGSPCYASPECISGKPYDGRTTDVWSVGVILYAMVTGKLPWTKRNQTQLFAQIKRGDYSIPEDLSESCRSFIKGLMTVDKDKRLTIKQAYEHEWLRNVPPQYENCDNPVPIVSLRAVDRFFNRDNVDNDVRGVTFVRVPSMGMVQLGRTVRLLQKHYGEVGQSVSRPEATMSRPEPAVSPPRPVEGKRTESNVYKGLRMQSRNLPTQGGRRRANGSKPGSSLLTRPKIKRPNLR